MNTRARTTRDTQGQVGQRKKELANKLTFANQANFLSKEGRPELGANDLTAKIPAGIPDIDADNKAEECGQYARHNFSYLRYLEVKHQTKGTDALENAGILPKWRVILVDWLREISQKLNVINETFYLAVGLLDRFFDRCETPVPKQDIQKVGVTALFIAAKYEEIYPPSVDDFADLCDGAYDTDDILRCEMDMFATLDFDLSQPYAIQFLRRFATVKKSDLDGLSYAGAKYLIELSVLDQNLLGIPTSIIAAAALDVSMKINSNLDWDKTLKFYSGYSRDDLKNVKTRLVELAHTANNTPDKKPLGKTRVRFGTPKNEEASSSFTKSALSKFDLN